MTSTSSSLNRRTLLGTTAAVVASNLVHANVRAAAEDTATRPFRINVPEEVLVDLRRRVATTRWPDRETVTDDSQGVPLATMQELARHWATDYDWRKVEARLNALPQFITQIDGLDIHFIHVRSRHENAMPLIVTHGWPGSVIEQLKIIDPLTNPMAHGASGSDAFHLVIPSMPGYGFSGKPTTTGWGPDRIARLDRADEAPGIHALCCARRRLGFAGLALDGKTGRSGTVGHSRQFAWHPSTRHCEGAAVRRSRAGWALERRKAGIRADPTRIRAATRLRTIHGDATANALRNCGLAHGPRRLAH
jgi:hypothetical protein